MSNTEHAVQVVKGFSGDKPSNAYLHEAGNNTAIHAKLLKQGSAEYSVPELQCANILREQYPTYSLIPTSDRALDPTQFPDATLNQLEEDKNIVGATFVLSRKSDTPGVIHDSMFYASHEITWKGYRFIVYLIKVPGNKGQDTVRFFLHNGPKQNIRDFLLAVGTWNSTLRNEMWVYDRGWHKDSKLWQEVQKADWHDVILKYDVKSTLMKDISGYFDAEDLYKRLSIQWKRGMILYGPPGNGKTSCVKAIMKTCKSKGFKPIYVCSLDDRSDISSVFYMARQLSPCVVILEDLDSLVGKETRSYFLNQLDGLDNNDGLLIIGTTNYVERLDPSLSSRPSRFDRKYLFANPDPEERKQYCKYWQAKAKDNGIEFPDSALDEVVNATDSFSFAYMKETFLSAFARFVTYEGETPLFVDILSDTIESLRKELATTSSSSINPESTPNEPLKQELERTSQIGPQPQFVRTRA